MAVVCPLFIKCLGSNVSTSGNGALRMNRLSWLDGVYLTLVSVFFFSYADAQDWGPRSLEELKSEILHRAESKENDSFLMDIHVP